MSIQSALRAIRTASANGGVPFPQHLLDEIARYETASAAGLATSTLDDLVDAVGNASLAGKDPHNDPPVAKALARHQLASAVGSWDGVLADWASSRIRDLLSDHAEELFSAWGTAITEAGERIASAVPHLERDRTLAEQSEDSLRAGPRRAKAWRDAYEAAVVVDQLASAQIMLGTQAVNLLGEPRGLRTIVRCIDITPQQLDQIPPNQTQDVWALAATHGLAIAGGGLSEIRDAVARVAAERVHALEDRQRRLAEAARSAPFAINLGR